MKKRKSYTTLSQSHPLRNTQSLSRVSCSPPLQESGSRVSLRNSCASPKSRRRTQARISSAPSKSSLSGTATAASRRREAFKSLDTLFDLTKFKLQLHEVVAAFSCPPLEEKPLGDNSDPEESQVFYSKCNFGRPEDFIEKLKPVFLDLDNPEQDLYSPTAEDKAERNSIEEGTLGKGDTEKLEVIPSLPKIEEDDAREMAEDEQKSPVPADEAVAPQDAQSVTTAENKPDDVESSKVRDEKSVTIVEDISTIRSEKDAIRSEKSAIRSDKSAIRSDKDTIRSEKLDVTKSAKDDMSIYAPAYPLPPGLGEGIAVPDGKHCDSVISSIPITESCAQKQIREDQERGACIREEIRELKMCLMDIQEKEELTVEETIQLKDIQTTLLQKVDELNNITRKMERTIGLIDPSSVTFAKMFEMLPYPHNKGPSGKDDEGPCTKIEDVVRVCEKFAFPQVEYPEDKLPRVIICGNTEDNFPKLVVADSRPQSRGNKCLQKLTGKLTESLTLQEKLAKENAQLEGGKYKLEKELLEKDNAVELLQRKVCGLQAEMRMVVKENSELNRKLVCLDQQQQQQQQQQQRRCFSQLSSTPRPDTVTTTASTCGSPKRQPIDLSCKCKERFENEQKPQNQNLCGRTFASPRLGGGASRGTDNCSPRKSPEMYNCRRSPPPPAPCLQAPRPPVVCPAEIEERLNTYGNNTRHLTDQLACIETEVRTLQAELLNTQRERQQLEQQRKLLECAGPCATCCPEATKPSSNILHKNQDYGSCFPHDEASEMNVGAAQQLCELREQYARLQDDYKSKLCEVSRLRSDAEALRRESREAREERERLEIRLMDAQERARAIEAERNDLLGTKEHLVEKEQALLVARQRFLEAQDELEELRTMIRDQAGQLDDYRNKYLQAQQQVEEQRRQLDLMEMDNARMNENVTLEIGRVKNQFQEKLAELAPLPDILKQTQMKLQETQQQRIMAEHNCEELSRELLASKDKIDAMQSQINDLQREIQNLQDERSDGCGRIDELERKNGELRNENERLKNAISRLEEQQAVVQKRLDEKHHEVVQLTSMLEQVREDSARQVSRTKERCEAVKRSMQSQISDFEVQLAQCRAAAKTAQKERDEIRQKMQGQIGNLNEALQQAQGRIRSLQGHVDYLKVSYSNVFGDQGQGESTIIPTSETPPVGQGYDSCDCNY